MVGPTGQLVNKILAKIGRPREEVFVGNITSCIPPRNSPQGDREIAAKCCAPRLKRELAQWPGLPVLTFGAVAARALIPKETLDAIDPPNVPKTKKRNQKARQRAEAKAEAKAAKECARSIDKIAKARFKEKVKLRRQQIIEEMTRPLVDTPYRRRKRPDKALIDRTIELDLPKMQEVADREAIQEWDLGAHERELAAKYAAANPKPAKPKKPKQVKITDIAGSTFMVDVDGTGPRALIPTIHPAALLRGGGATIGGTHTPDLAFINLIYDAGKVNAIAQGKDVWLKLNVETEIEDSERAWQLLRDVVFEAIEEGEIGIDLETYVDDPERHHALMAYMARIRAVGLATSKRSASILWDLIPEWALSYFQLVLAHLNVTKTFHNGLYDRTVLANAHNAFEIAGPWDDTLLAHHAAFPGCAHKLQTVTSQFFAVAPWKAEFRNAEETPQGLTAYNAKDTGATMALRPQLTLMVKKTKTEEVYELDKKMAEIASRMHLAGMPVSREVNSELLATFSKNVKESRQAVEAIAEDPKNRERIWHYLALQQAQKRRKIDPSEFELADGRVVHDFEARYQYRLREIRLDSKWKWKIGGAKHIAALLQAMGVSLHQVTATGQISTKKEILESLVNVPIVRDVLTFRENDKLLSTFVWSIYDRFNSDGDCITRGFADDNNRIHPIWSVHAITGRWRAGEPNCQNVPKDKFKRMSDGTKKILRPNLRRQIMAPAGRIFVGFDFCLAKGTLIDTPTGHRPIEALKPGDLVYSYNHETKRPDCSKVTAQRSTGYRATLKVVIDNDEEVRCTPDHRWLVRPWGGGENGVVEIEAKDLKPGMRLLPMKRNHVGKGGQDYETLYSYSAFKYVVAVIDDGLVVETFDIEVERDHNFALAAGVFVHNCQLEARVIALISGDPFLCQVFADGKDIHRECAMVIFANFDKLPKDDQKQARDDTKAFEYGAFYGGAPETLWKALLKQGRNIKLVDVAKAVAILMQRMTGVVAWQRDCVTKASQPPYEIREFLLGRRRTFPLGQVEPSESMNFGVQGAGASIMNMGMARMDARLRKYREAYAVIQVHDAAVFEIWEDDAPKVVADVKECFTQEHERDGRLIPFPVEVKIGRSWADV